MSVGSQSSWAALTKRCSLGSSVTEVNFSRFWKLEAQDQGTGRFKVRESLPPSLPSFLFSPSLFFSKYFSVASRGPGLH